MCITDASQKLYFLLNRDIERAALVIEEYSVCVIFFVLIVAIPIYSLFSFVLNVHESINKITFY